MDRFFKRAEDLIFEKEYNNLNFNNNYFYKASDFDLDYIEDKYYADMSVENIKSYLKTIVSGREFEMDCELGTLCGGGSCIVSFDELQNMIIEYQHFSKEFSKKL